MMKGVTHTLEKYVRRQGSIRRRLFWLLAGMSLATILVINLVWLPGAILDIREANAELQRIAVRGVRDQIQLFLEEKERALKSQTMLFRPPFLQDDKAALRQLAYRFFQREPAFVEIGILDAQGQERLRISRVLTLTDRDLEDRSSSALFQEVLQQPFYWGPVVTSETSEPWVTLAMPLERSKAAVVGVVYGILNLKSLWEVTGGLQLSRGGRLYVIDQVGQLVAADDQNLVLQQLSFADRPLVQHLVRPVPDGEMSFVQGEYINEHGLPVMATGLSLPRTSWGVVVEQPLSILYAPIRQKLWFGIGFSVVGVLLNIGLAQIFSRRFTAPITRLREGVEQIGGGHLGHQVAIETHDEIGELAQQFNRMAAQLRASYDGLEQRVAARTAQLQAANAQLQEEMAKRQQAEAILRATETKYRTMIEQVTDAIVVLQDGKIVYRNPALATTLGHTSDDTQAAAGRDFLDFVAPEDHARVRAYAQQRMRGEPTPSQYELTLVSLHGRRVTVEVKPSLIDYDDHPATLVVLRDITARKQAEQSLAQTNVELQQEIAERQRTAVELRQAKTAAEAASRAKSEFLANMSHEIRTPMNGVIGMTELALDTELTAEQREYLTTVKSSAEALLGVLNDILDFSKIEAGKLTLDPIPFVLRDCLSAALKPLALRAHEKGLELAYQVQSEVPDAVVGDPGRLRQILVNLVGNAIKFTEHGEVVVQVEPEVQAGDELWLHMAVRDTGVGIPPDKWQAILEPFTQADGSITRRFGGTGLGLTITKQLVELMAGRLWLESDVGRGSTFHFTVQLGLQPAQIGRPEPTPSLDLEGLPVLVVDDNATNRRILDQMLTHFHLRPTSVNDADAALAALDQAYAAGTPFPLVLLDAQMPGTDGFTLADRVRQHPEFTGAVMMMLTSAGQRGDAARCRELGIAAYLTKPIAQSELWKAIQLMLARRPALVGPAPLITRHSMRERRRSLHVLLAEDNVVNQKLAVLLLQKQGHTVVAAGNGEEALAALAQQPFDLVFMDVQMPVMDGLEATAAIRQREQQSHTHIPIIAMTAHAMQGDRERCLAAGMDDYLSKPMKAGELEAALDRVWQRTPDLDAPQAEAPLDLSTALSAVGGDRALLAHLVGVFLEYYPTAITELRMAVAAGDASQVEKLAHSLKGAISTFEAETSFALANDLEIMGREARLSDAPATLQRLEEALERIKVITAEPGWGERLASASHLP
jgi:PAS domain S-box-containing protein